MSIGRLDGVPHYRRRIKTPRREFSTAVTCSRVM
jgi:hypothetical protein